MPSRREFLASAATVGLFAAAPTLWWQYGNPPRVRLSSRPKKRTKVIAAGTHSLGLGNRERDGFLYLPRDFNPGKPAPLILALHGATQAGRFMVDRVSPLADSIVCPMLAPDSREMTWDGIQGRFDIDIAFIDRALAWTFDRVDIDPKRVWLAGFSDGASYGLSVAAGNGDLFSRILAFSPGFMRDVELASPKPRIFVSHGTNDQILPIDRTSRVLVPALRKEGYDVRYEEFAGRHGVPPEILAMAAGWLKTP
jgi:phospholipase/carboxylesterase